MADSAEYTKRPVSRVCEGLLGRRQYTDFSVGWPSVKPRSLRQQNADFSVQWLSVAIAVELLILGGKNLGLAV